MAGRADNRVIGRFDLTAAKEVLASLFAKVGRDNISRLASSFSFFALLSLTPMVVFAVGLAALIWGQSSAADQLKQKALDFGGAQVQSYVAGIIQSSQHGAAATTATVLGLLVTFYSASNLFLQLDDAVNTIWGIKTEGPFVHNFIKTRIVAFLLVLLFGALLLAWLGFDWFMTWINHETGTFTGWGSVSFLASLVFLSVVFSITFHALPRGRLKWRDVWLGGLVTGTGITVGKSLLTQYLARMSGVYGAAGGAVIMLLWLYYSSMIYFFGIEVTYLYAHRFGSQKTAHDPLPCLDVEKQGLKAS